MINLRKVQSKVFYKYLISYLIIFSIPFIILSVFVYRDAVINLKEGIESSSIQNLNQVKDITDTHMEELGNIAARISMDWRLSPYMVKNNTREAIQELGNFKANSSMIDGLFLHFTHGDVFYSPAGLYSSPTLQNYSFSDWSQNLDATLDQVKYPTVKQTKNRIVYIYPISPKSKTPYGTVTFLIKKSSLAGPISNILGNYKGSVFILNGYGDLLAASANNSGHLSIPKMLSFSKEFQSGGIHKVQYNGKGFSLMSVRSEKSGWRFIATMPTAQFYNRVAKEKTLVYLIFLFIIVAGIAVSVIMSIRQYRPIHKLINDLRSKTNNGAKVIQRKNEFESIRDSFEVVYNRQKDLLTQIEKNQPLVREHFLINLLKGSYEERKNVNDFVRTYKMNLVGPCFFVMHISLGKQRVTAERREEILRELSMPFSNGAIAYGVEHINQDAITLIVNLPKGEEQRKRSEMAENIYQFFLKKLGILSGVGVGTICKGLMQINRSFIEALAASEYRFVNGQNEIIYFDDTKELSAQASWYPIKEQIKLTQSLKQGDKEVALESLNIIMKSIRTEEQCLSLLKCRCFDIINTVLKTLTEMNMKDFLQNVESLLTFESIDELEGHLSKLIENVCSEVQQEEESKREQRTDDILAYIQENFHSYNLSLEDAAEHFNISGSYLSRLIKQEFGMTFNNYVVSLRMEKVKKDLIYTDKPVKEIVMGVGYVDSSNFTRKFKKYEGITPGQYRKIYSNGEMMKRRMVEEN